MGNYKIESLRLNIRRRPGMYVGSLGSHGIRVLLDDLITELLTAPGSRPDRMRCTLGCDGAFGVELQGGTVPAIEPEEFDADRSHLNAPLLALAITSALSDRLEAEIVRDGRRWSCAYAAGVPAGAPVTGVSTDPPLLRIRYHPDAALFHRETENQFLRVCGGARERAAFYPHVRFTIADEGSGQRRDFHYPAGLQSLAEELEWHWHGAYSEYPVWHCAANEGSESAEAVLVNRPCGGPIVHSFVNGVRTLGGGTHVDGLWRGIADVAKRLPIGLANSPDLRFRDRDLTILLAVRLAKPEWQHSTKDVLGDRRAYELVRRMIVRQLPRKIARDEQAE